jgi:hypothetical protein
MRRAFTVAGIALLAWAAGPERPTSTAALVSRLTRAGHGEARLAQTVMAAGESLRSDRGRLTLEPPDRLRLDFAGSGERITMRGDGGEWLQPATRQLLVLRPEQAQAVVSMWRAFLTGGGEAYGERALGGRRYRLVARRPDPGLPDSLAIELGADGLPARIRAWTGDQQWTLQLSGWSFGRARGAAHFTLRAPAGYAVFEWP